MILQLASLLPLLTLASPFPSLPHRAPKKPAAFFLAGDSTTAVLSSGGGGTSLQPLLPKYPTNMTQDGVMGSFRL